jgi:hypothetical protein
MSHVILGGRWCDIIVLNEHAPTEDKMDDMKASCYEKLEYAFDKFPKYNTKILLGDFNAKVVREDIFKPTVGNESLHDNGGRPINYTTSKNLIVKSIIFHLDISWWKDTQTDHIFLHWRLHSSVLDIRSFKGAECDTDCYLVVAS